MPKPDHELVYGTSLDVGGPLRPRGRVMVLAMVEVRSDKTALTADDDERHVYGGKLLLGGFVAEGSEAFNTLAETLHQVAGVNADDPSLFNQPDDPTPERAVEDVELPARYVAGTDSIAMAPVRLTTDGPAHQVSMADLERLELSTHRFYDAAHRLKSGEALADVTLGWTTEQVAYLETFIPKKRTKRTTTKSTTDPQETP